MSGKGTERGGWLAEARWLRGTMVNAGKQKVGVN